MLQKAQVVVAGRYRLDHVGHVSDAQDSTIWRYEGWSGCYTFEANFDGGPGNRRPAWLRKGRLLEVNQGGHTSWDGFISEVTPNGDGTLKIAAKGYGAQVEGYQAFAEDLDAGAGNAPVKSTLDADLALAHAHDRGCKLRPSGTLGVVQESVPDGLVMPLGDLLVAAGRQAGLRLLVERGGYVRLEADPQTPMWICTDPLLDTNGTADDEYVTALAAAYWSVLDDNGQASGLRFVQADDPYSTGREMAVQHGAREATVDLRPLGVLPALAAQMNVDGRFKLVGGRMAMTNPIDLTPLNLRRLGGGTASPMSVRAGQMVRQAGRVDASSTPTVRPYLDRILGEVKRYHETQTAVGIPMGFAPRDYSSGLAAAQTPVSPDL